MTLMRRVEEIGSDIKDQLSSGIQKYVSVSLAWLSSRTMTLQFNFLFLSEE